MKANLGNMPTDWQQVRFDEIAEIITERVENPSESGLKDFIGLEHLDTDNIRIKRFGLVEDVKSSKFICKKGDIIFGRRRAYLRKMAISDRDAVVSTDAMILRPTGNKIRPDFLPCFMQSSIFWKAVLANSEGSMSPRIKWKVLAQQEFWIPSIEEQKRIIETIRNIQKNLDDNEKIIQISRKIKKGLLNELLTNGIGHHNTKSTEVGNIPEEWAVRKLSDICIKIKSGGTPKSTKKEYYQGDIPFVKIEDMTSCNKYLQKTKQMISQEGFDSSNTWMIPEDSILYSIYATVGEVTINKIAVATNQAILGIIPNLEIIKLEFLYYYLEKIKPYLDQYFLETTQKNLTGSTVKNLELGIPSIEEQEEIIVKLRKIDQHIEEYEFLFTLTLGLKKKIVDELLSGKITIPVGVLENVQ